ncbi:hypothetical protein FRC08_016240 [Ceratobasidium sp. 394]|nr:hypothetical protein FRC08_016240 [Ceratobasidium sp. 394]
MSRRGEGAEPHNFNQCTDGRVMGEAELPTVPLPMLALEPTEKKIKWRQTFSLKGRGKEKADAHTELPSPLSPPVPPFSYTNSYPGSPLAAPPLMPAKDSNTARKCEPLDLESVPRPMSTMGSYVIVDSPVGESDSESSYILVGREIGNLFPGEVSVPNQADSLGSLGDDPAIKPQGRSPDKPLTCETTVTPLVTEKAVGSRHIEVDSPRSASGTPGQTHTSPVPTISPRSSLPQRTVLSSISEVPIPVPPQACPPAASAEREASSVADDTSNPSDTSLGNCDRVDVSMRLSGVLHYSRGDQG